MKENLISSVFQSRLPKIRSPMNAEIHWYNLHQQLKLCYFLPSNRLQRLSTRWITIQDREAHTALRPKGKILSQIRNNHFSLRGSQALLKTLVSHSYLPSLSNQSLRTQQIQDLRERRSFQVLKWTTTSPPWFKLSSSLVQSRPTTKTTTHHKVLVMIS